MLVRISFCLTFNRIAWSACAVSIRIATLSDEAWNDSMKGQAVVKAFIRQAFKVLNSVWCCFRVKFDDDFFSPLSKEMLPFFSYVYPPYQFKTSPYCTRSESNL